MLAAQFVQRYWRRKDKDLLYIDVTVPSRPAWCLKDNIECNLPRDGTDDAAAEDDAQDAATTPEERGGDSAIVDAAVASQ